MGCLPLLVVLGFSTLRFLQGRRCRGSSAMGMVAMLSSWPPLLRLW